jgi:hypothetical protein
MDMVARTDTSGARVFGGSTFAYSCFLVASCPTNWLVGNPQQPLVVSDSDALAVGRMVSRVLSWAATGATAELRVATPEIEEDTELVAPEGGLVRQRVEQEPIGME